MIVNKETWNQAYMFTYKQIKKNIKVTQTWGKDEKTFNTPAYFQTFKRSSIQTKAKAW